MSPVMSGHRCTEGSMAFIHAKSHVLSFTCHCELLAERPGFGNRQAMTNLCRLGQLM